MLLFYGVPLIIGIILIFILDCLDFPLYLFDIIVPFIPVLNIIWLLIYIILFIVCSTENIIRFFYKIFKYNS